MKSERGVTITSVLIYIIALTAVVILIGRITTYFYRNMNSVTENTAADAEYTKFNSYLTDEINIEGNTVIACGTTEEGNNYIIFSETENQYTYQKNKDDSQKGSIYRNKTKISTDIEECEFKYDETTEVITVNLKILGKTYNNTYTIAK